MTHFTIKYINKQEETSYLDFISFGKEKLTLWHALFADTV